MSTLPSPGLDPSQATAPSAIPAPSAARPLLICVPSLPSEVSASVLGEINQTFYNQPILVASPDVPAEQPASNGLPALVNYAQPRSESEWVLSAADYSAAARLAQEHNAYGVLLLGPEAGSLHPHALRSMQEGLAGGADLAIPRYQTGADEGLVNSALLYPITRALFGADIRFPLPLDAGLSPRMLARLAANTARLGSPLGDELLWPVADASIAGFSVRQVDGGARTLPRPQEADLNQLFPAVTASLFADVESKATYWQRARAVPVRPVISRAGSSAPSEEGAEEVRALVENFRLAFNNLRDIWSLVLPPQSLLALKKLSVSSPETFQFPPSLWARTVYDFALAFHLRTLNRGHLLGSFTPLYLAWVASFLRANHNPDLLEITATAFEQEKPYIVSRWRWPDRFNP